jgi:UDP-glucose 4-epimerase
MRILVTGGAGYVGSHSVKHFLARGHDVWVYDNLSSGHRDAVPVERLLVADLAETARLEHVLSARRIQAVVHFAASSLVGESVRDPAAYYRNNVGGSLSLLEAMRRAGVGRIVFSSTCATYGIPEGSPLTEDEPQRPINPYGNTKLAVERALTDYAAAYGWGVAILRYFNAAGASSDGALGEDHEPETHLIPLVIRAALGQRGPIDVFGTDYDTPDGTCVRDYVHVEDLADAHLRVLEAASAGVRCYNLGTGRGHSVREVLHAVEEVAGKPVPYREGPRRAGDAPVLVASPRRALEELDWSPRFLDLREIVRTAWRWHSGHPFGYADRRSAA